MAPKAECIDAQELNTRYADLLSQSPFVEAKSPHYLHQYLTRRLYLLLFVCIDICVYGQTHSAANDHLFPMSPIYHLFCSGRLLNDLHFKCYSCKFRFWAAYPGPRGHPQLFSMVQSINI